MEIFRLETGTLDVQLSQSQFDLLFRMLCTSTYYAEGESDELMNGLYPYATCSIKKV